jgi:thioredoxin-like negative regulator of GroEL
MMFKAILIIVFSAASAQAGIRTAGQVKTELKDGKFTATINDGFHINEKAPNSASVDGNLVKATKLSAREIQFAELPKEFKSGIASIYICDDAVTFCETSQIDMKTGAETLPLAAPPPDKNAKKKKKKKGGLDTKAKGIPNKHGFYEDEYDFALNEAKANKKLLLVDFSARWCPGCVRLEIETFPLEAFKKLTADYVKVKVDVDRFENSVIAEKFVIKGIPTLLVLTADQEEVGRIVDYQPMDRMTRFFSSIAADPVSLRELGDKSRDKNPETLLRFGKRLLAAGRAGEAIEALKQIKPPPPELLTAQVNAYPKDVKVLRAAIKEEPNSSRSIAWRSSLVSMIDRFDEKMRIRNEGVNLADELLANPEKLKEAVKTDEVGEFTDFEAFLVAMARADLIESAGGSTAEIDAAWKKVSQIATSLKIPERNVGVSMRHLIVLTKAKEYQAADKLARRLVKADPKNPELQRRRLRLLFELKDFDGTVKLGKKVITDSYGRNEFWAAETVAKAYVQTGKKKEAREFIDSYLGRAEMDWPNMKETRKTLEELRLKVPNS